ncbi:MAG: M20/M25/M40 family metallo-hydrolase, partial [Selenomonadaceae bacterium]|nr:M20/M25/M40 family metallo-hydrolase [Selenomonadaceae bacterium]
MTEQLATLSNVSAPGEGINRLAFTDSDWQGRSYLMKLMKDAGLTLRVDAFGNVIGHYAGRNDSLPAIMFGSHGDSVPEGGNYDGIVGILSAIETVRSMQEDGYQPEQPLEVVLFMCEESSRFGAATLGSRAMRGELSSEDLHRLKDREGHTL